MGTAIGACGPDSRPLNALKQAIASYKPHCVGPFQDTQRSRERDIPVVKCSLITSKNIPTRAFHRTPLQSLSLTFGSWLAIASRINRNLKKATRASKGSDG